jgi:hypothetical protein
MEGLWGVAYQPGDYHLVQVGFRDHREMTIWFTGRQQTAMLSRLELEWEDLFRDPAGIAGDDGNMHAIGSVRALSPFPNPASPASGADRVTIPFMVSGAAAEGAWSVHEPRLRILDLSGRTIRILTPESHFAPPSAGNGFLLLFRWEGKDTEGRRAASGVYPYALLGSMSPASGCTLPGNRIVWIHR